MKNTTTPEFQTLSELIANNKLTKEGMHEAIEQVAGLYMGFRSSAYQLHFASNGFEGISVFAHYHGGKCYCGTGYVQQDTPAIEAIATALTTLNENIRKGFEMPEADLTGTEQSPLECLEVFPNNDRRTEFAA